MAWFALLLHQELILDFSKQLGFNVRVRADHQRQVVSKFMSVKVGVHEGKPNEILNCLVIVPGSHHVAIIRGIEVWIGVHECQVNGIVP